jgi:putative ABC transport system permease protein
MTGLWADIRFGIRVLSKSRGFSSVAIIILALGIGTTTAIFSVVNATLLRPLPYADPERIVMIWGVNPKLNMGGLDRVPNSPGQFTDYLSQSDSFEGLAAFDSVGAVNLEGRGEPEKLGATRVTADFFAVLGVKPRLGRAFLPEENRPGQNRVVLLSHDLWQRRFGADSAIVNQSIMLSGASYTVVGVMPPDFHYPRGKDLPTDLDFSEQTDLWSPMVFTPANINARYQWNYPVIARLRSGVTIEAAEKQLNMIAARNQERYPQTDAGFGTKVIQLQEQIVGNFRQIFLMLLGAAGFVLLIACANVASLLLVRAIDRQRELALRSALGADRLRLIRQLLTESILLSVIGGGAGLALAFWGVKLLVVWGPRKIPGIMDISLDFRVVAFAFAMALLTGILFGLASAWHASRPDLNRSLKEGGRGTIGPLRHAQKATVVIEIALALVLLIGTGLMVRSFARLYQVDLGLVSDGVLTLQPNLPHRRYPTEKQRAEFYTRVAERIKAIPGVSSVAYTCSIPLTGHNIVAGFIIEGRLAPSSLDQTPLAKSEAVTVDYFRTLNIPLLTGRTFTEYDNQESPGVVIINDALAHHYFPGEYPIGKRLKVGAIEVNDPWQEIVGVVRGVRTASLDAEPEPELYLPFQQRPEWDLALLLRTTSNPENLVAAVRKEIQAEDGNVPVFRVATMNRVIADSVSERRFNLMLMSLFAIVALLLAATGIYGVMSYLVTQRAHEIGVRMALGAQRFDVVMMVIRQGSILVLTGLFMGLVMALALTRVMKSLLFGVSATDPLTFVVISFLFIAVALISNLIPALRATKIDPLLALKHD